MTPSGETEDFDAMQLDGLKEIGSIGAAHASSALSQLVKKDILVEVSECYVCRTQDLPTVFPDADQTMVAVFLEATGRSKGGIMLVLSQGMALGLIDMVLGRKHQEGQGLDEMDQDAICEIGNICASAYLSAVAKFTDVIIIPSPPGVAVDMLRAILQFPAALVEETANTSVVVKTQFVHGKETCQGFILYIPDLDTQMAMIEKFGSL
jgi:chemotaxis protein CheC